MEGRAESGHNNPLAHLGHPFIDNVMMAPFPKNFKPLNMERYDGNSDPEEHLTAFNTQMLLTTVTKIVKYRTFPTTLKGAALNYMLDYLFFLLIHSLILPQSLIFNLPLAELIRNLGHLSEF